jgi:hypothetical protein
MNTTDTIAGHTASPARPVSSPGPDRPTAAAARDAAERGGRADAR